MLAKTLSTFLAEMIIDVISSVVADVVVQLITPGLCGKQQYYLNHFNLTHN